MAGENQNTGPSLKGSTDAARDQLDISRETRRESGDIRDLLKDSESILRKMVKSYESIEGKLGALSKQTINIREINKALQRGLEDQLNLNKKIDAVKGKESDSLKDFLKFQKDQKDIIEDIKKAEAAGDLRKAQFHQEELDRVGLILDRRFKALNVEEQAYVNNLKSRDVLNEQMVFAKEKLDIEKKTADSVGITGRLLGRIGSFLGSNNEAYGELVEKTRRQVEETGKGLTFSQKLGFVFKSLKDGVNSTVQELGGWGRAIAIGAVVGVKKLLDLTGAFAKGVANSVADFQKMSGDQVIGKLTSGISSIASKIPFIGGILSGMVDAFGKILELSLAEDDRIVKLGRDLGVSKTEAAAINDNFVKISLNSKSTVVNAAALVESQKELSRELGVTNVFSGQILSTNLELSKLAGIEVKARAAIAQSSIITGRSSEAITKSVLGQVGMLKAATGISFDYKKILSEASGFSGVLGLQFAKYPDKLAKTLVETKSIGLELNKLNSMADSFLNFEDSISKEFEAQLLTGKNINLAKAREAFLNNDLATAAKEITRQVGNANQFLKMNRIQQDALAASMGMSKEDLADMLKNQEMLSKLGARDLKDAQAKVEALKAQGKSREQIVKMVGEEAYTNLTNASAQEKIAGFLEKVQSAIASFLSKSPIVDLIDKAMKFLSEPENITRIVVKIQSVFATLFDIMGGVAAGIMRVANFFNAGIDESIIRKASQGGAFIRRLNLTEGGTSVGENAARRETFSSQNASESQRSMRGPAGGVNLYVDNHMNPITGQSMTTVVMRDANADAQTGEMSGQSTQ